MRSLLHALATLKQFVRVYASIPDEPSLRQEQASILHNTVFLFAALGTGSGALFMIALNGWTSRPVIAAYCGVVAAYLCLLGVGLRWQHTRDHVAFIRTSVRLLFWLGVAWGVLINLFALRARMDQQATVTGLVMALVSAPMMGVPLSAGLAFFVPVAVACSIVVVFLIQPLQYVTILSFLGFLVFTLSGLVSMNKMIMDRLVGRLNLQREHETVRVFLREYEEVSADWLWETDMNGRLRNVAAQLVEVLGIPAAEMEGFDLFNRARGERLPSNDCQGVIETMRREAAFRDRTFAVSTRNGVRWLKTTGHPVYNREGVFQGYRGIGSDITTARLDQQRIEFLARHDGLTKLLSRRAFVAETIRMLDVPTGADLAMVLIDLDDFKQVNDDLGHLAGDALLETVATRLNGQLDPHELAARIGGDEFALLIRVTSAAHAAVRADQLTAALRIEVDGGGSTLPISASLGLALAPEHGTCNESLMRRADLALYEAKSRGKGIACMFEHAMETAYLSRQRLLSELGVAIEQDQIIVEYQPIFDIGSGQMVSSEALVRWRHPVRGMLPAGEFVLAAEGSNLIEPLGERVLRLACRAAMGWEEKIPVAVNLSPRQLRSGRFVPILRSCLVETGLPPSRLTLEVTETVFLDASSRVMEQLDLVRAMGVRIVLDDFGTGYSSLTYLHRFEVDGIKIDASFVRNLPESHKVGAIVRTIGRLASDMNIYVTAEGVETEEQLRWLRVNGIAFAQGFLLGRPARDPASAMRAAAAERQHPAGSAAAGRSDAGRLDPQTATP